MKKYIVPTHWDCHGSVYDTKEEAIKRAIHDRDLSDKMTGYFKAFGKHSRKPEDVVPLEYRIISREEYLANEREIERKEEEYERAIAELRREGFKTFASIEPIINLNESGEMIRRTLGFCDLYKIGLLTGHKQYTREDVAHFVVNINDMVLNHNFDHCEDVKVYWKDSVLEFLKMDKEYRYNVSPFSWRFDMSFHVDANYDMFH